MLTRRNPRRRPAHPGAVLRDLVLPPLGMSKARLARVLGLSRYQLCQILAEKGPVRAYLRQASGGAYRPSPTE